MSDAPMLHVGDKVQADANNDPVVIQAYANALCQVLETCARERVPESVTERAIDQLAKFRGEIDNHVSVQSCTFTNNEDNE